METLQGVGWQLVQGAWVPLGPCEVGRGAGQGTVSSLLSCS